MKAVARTLVASVLSAAVVACPGGKAPSPCRTGPAAEEYAVFSAAIEEFIEGRTGKLMVVSDRAEDVSDPAGVTSEWVRRCEAFVRETDKTSRVGFNAGTNRAVVYVSQRYCGLGCGEGACMVPVSEGCERKVREKGGVWMS